MREIRVDRTKSKTKTKTKNTPSREVCGRRRETNSAGDVAVLRTATDHVAHPCRWSDLSILLVSGARLESQSTHLELIQILSALAYPSLTAFNLTGHMAV